MPVNMQIKWNQMNSKYKCKDCGSVVEPHSSKKNYFGYCKSCKKDKFSYRIYKFVSLSKGN